MLTARGIAVAPPGYQTWFAFCRGQGKSKNNTGAFNKLQTMGLTITLKDGGSLAGNCNFVKLGAAWPPPQSQAGSHKLKTPKLLPVFATTLKRAMLEKDLGLKEVAALLDRSVGTVKRALLGHAGERTEYKILTVFKEYSC